MGVVEVQCGECIKEDDHSSNGAANRCNDCAGSTSLVVGSKVNSGNNLLGAAGSLGNNDRGGLVVINPALLYGPESPNCAAECKCSGANVLPQVDSGEGPISTVEGPHVKSDEHNCGVGTNTLNCRDGGVPGNRIKLMAL